MTDESTAIAVLELPNEGRALDAIPAKMVSGYLATLQSEKSRDTVGESLRRITRVLAAGNDERAFPWHKLEFEQMTVIRERLAANHPPSTANLSLSAMRQMLKIAHVRGFISQEQRAALDLVKNVRGSRLTKGRALEDDELEQLWKHCRNVEGNYGTMLRAMIAVFVGAGLRREEVCALRIADFRGRDLAVVGKGNKERRMPVDAGMRERLDEWMVVRKALPTTHKLMFCTLARRGNPSLSPWAIWYQIETVTTLAGLVDERGHSTVNPHDFRRTFASTLLKKHFDLSEVQKLMGHENIATTQRYDKRKEAELADKRRAMTIFDFEAPQEEK